MEHKNIKAAYRNGELAALWSGDLIDLSALLSNRTALWQIGSNAPVTGSSWNCQSIKESPWFNTTTPSGFLKAIIKAYPFGTGNPITLCPAKTSRHDFVCQETLLLYADLAWDVNSRVTIHYPACLTWDEPQDSRLPNGPWWFSFL